MTPAPAFQPVEVPANMRAFETVHGQVFPVMKGEEACAPSNASSESGATFSTQKAEEQVKPDHAPSQTPAYSLAPLLAETPVLVSSPGMAKRTSKAPLGVGLRQQKARAGQTAEEAK